MHTELNLSSKGVQTQSNSAEEDEFMLSPSLKAPLLGSLPGFAGGNQREFRGKGRGLSRHSDLAVTEPGGRGSGYEPPKLMPGLAIRRSGGSGVTLVRDTVSGVDMGTAKPMPTGGRPGISMWVGLDDPLEQKRQQERRRLRQNRVRPEFAIRASRSRSIEHPTKEPPHDHSGPAALPLTSKEAKEPGSKQQFRSKAFGVDRNVSFASRVGAAMQANTASSGMETSAR